MDFGLESICKVICVDETWFICTHVMKMFHGCMHGSQMHYTRFMDGPMMYYDGSVIYDHIIDVLGMVGSCEELDNKRNGLN